VVLLWRYCHDLCTKVGKHFDPLRPMALLLLLELLTAAAAAAISMQRQAADAANAAAAVAAASAAAAVAAAADSDSGSSSSSSDGSSDGSRRRRCHRRSGSSSSYGVTCGPRSALGDISAASDTDEELQEELHGRSVSSQGPSGWGSGTWGDSPALGAGSGSGTSGDLLGQGVLLRGSRRQRRGPLVTRVSDEAIQAQAWLPQLLHGLLHHASSIAKQVGGG